MTSDPSLGCLTQVTSGRPVIIITELPYQTNKAAFVADVARLVNEQKLVGALAASLSAQPCGFSTNRCCKISALNHVKLRALLAHRQSRPCWCRPARQADARGKEGGWVFVGARCSHTLLAVYHNAGFRVRG